MKEFLKATVNGSCRNQREIYFNIDCVSMIEVSDRGCVSVWLGDSEFQCKDLCLIAIDEIRKPVLN